MRKKVIFNNIQARWKLSFLSVVTLFVSLVFGLFGVWLYYSVQNFFIVKNIGNSPLPNKITITQKAKSMNIFATGDNELARLSKVLEKDPNISTLHYIYNFDIPTTLDIDLLGSHFITDTFLFAVSDAMFSVDIPPLDFGANLDSTKNSRIPVGFSSKLLDLYNLEIATVGLFPKIDTSLAKLLSFDINFGKSSFFAIRGKSRKSLGKVTDISNNFPTMGITIPVSVAKTIQKHLGIGTLKLYTILAYTTDPKYTTVLQDEYQKDFSLVTDADSLQKIKKNMRAVQYLLFLINGILRIVITSFILFLVMSILHQNKKTLTIFSMHGASRLQLMLIILGEVLLYIFLALILTIFVIIWYNMIGVVLINQKITNIGLTYQVARFPSLIVIACFSLYTLFLLLITIWGSRHTIKKMS